ncbi:pentatricopeptide repeat-containing protein At4g39952, mitochondrial [Aristolochia californica]|uniref:pentatricopeptide repeat-containing protein At4g39952, mitochondrial n=1 Tax=Aristolochia californica TaxID=171875 RepID=UPI0035DF4C28
MVSANSGNLQFRQKICLLSVSSFSKKYHSFSSVPANSDLKTLLHFHSLVITSGNHNNIFFSSKLISLYSFFNQPNVSTLVFYGTNAKDTFLWNSIIKSHFANGKYVQSIEFYFQMRRSCMILNHFTIPMVVSACAELRDIDVGSTIHGVAMKFNLLVGNSAVGSALIYMYSRCGHMDEASNLFEEMPLRDVVTWTALIVGYVNNEESEKGLSYLCKMLRSTVNAVRPNAHTIGTGLQACRDLGALQEGRCLHSFAVKTGTLPCNFVSSSLLSMYSKCESVEESHLAFLELPSKDLVSWTTIISMYVKKGDIFKCLDMFAAMRTKKVKPDGIILSCLLMGIGNFASIKEGRIFHGLILRSNYESDISVSNSLLSIYCKLGWLRTGEKFFSRMHQRNAESWNWMVFGYGKTELVKCLECFREMQFLGLEADLKSLVTVISSCCKLGALYLGRAVHCYMIKVFLHEDVSIANSLIGMYGKCEKLNVSKIIFDSMNKDVVTWNTMIATYASTGHSSDALLIFDQMLLEGIKPNSATLVSVLSACAGLAALDYGERVHNYIKEREWECELSVGTALIDMYAKCGQLGTSRKIFDLMLEKDVISWNVMISGYGINGYANDAVEVFRQMEKSSLTPNEVTFLAVLSACSHGGLVEEGRCLFNRMSNYYAISPTLKHYASMVDLLGRSGNLLEAETMILKMPMVPDGGVWGTLLGSCVVQNNVVIGERVAKRAIEADPENDGYYILMSNMYGSVGRWEEVENMRLKMKNKGVKKRAGWSAMELDGKVHLFLVGDESHPSSEEIYRVLHTLYRQMEEFKVR